MRADVRSTLLDDGFGDIPPAELMQAVEEQDEISAQEAMDLTEDLLDKVAEEMGNIREYSGESPRFSPMVTESQEAERYSPAGPSDEQMDERAAEEEAQRNDDERSY